MMKRDFMKVIFLFTAFSLISSLFHSVQGQKQLQGIDSLSFEVILTDKMLSDTDLKGRFINSLDITPERLILLSTPDQYYLLGWGGMIPLGKRMTREIQSFAYTPDGLLLTVRGNELCSFDSLGNLSAMLRLPRQGMGVSAGQEVIYLFDRNPGQKLYPIYVLARGGRYLKLLETPDPVTSVAETDDAVLFAAGANLYSVNPLTKELKLLYKGEDNKTILSVAYDWTNDIAYFSTADKIFAARDTELGIVSEKAGGILRYFNGLIVFDPAAKLVIRILGLEKVLASKQVSTATQAVSGTQAVVDYQAPAPTTRQTPAQTTQQAPAQTTQQTPVQTTQQAPAQTTRQAPVQTTVPGTKSGDIATVKVLTNESVVDLVRNGLSDNIIINLIRRAEVDFSLTTDDVINLSGRSVSPDVIMEMRQAMKRQSFEIQNK
ncbi:MAG: hypothetical protein IH592_06300 [Bacteroidales bacterium]|nr:hypothetical protein [Bacteroidales bacterium]